MVKKIKELLKRNPEPARGTVGVNPSDPWSAKANIAESGQLDTYLKSRGINPKFISKDTKISHSKSNEFQKWKNDRKFESVEYLDEDAMLARYLMSRGINPKYVTKNQLIAHSKSGEFTKWKHDHMVESMNTQHTPFEIRQHALKKSAHMNKVVQKSDISTDGHDSHALRKEEVDKKDTVTLDIPLLIRVLELAREDIKSDMDLHRVVERLIKIRTKGMLTMDDYDTIAKINENHIAIAMGKMLDDESGMVLTQLEQLERAIGMIRSYIGTDYEKQLPAWVQAKITLATDYVDTVGNYITSKNEKVTEQTKPSALDKWRKSAAEREQKHKEIEKNQSKDGSGMTSAIDRLQKHLNKENTLDPLAATEAPCDCANGGDDSSTKKHQMSKSARMIKSLYKKLNMKEDTYDWEKDDKNQTSPGKKNPKLFKADPKASTGEGKPEARAVMSGGTTLTGEPRDTVEIDPLMKNRPDLNGNLKDDGNKKNNKINN